MDAGTKLPRMSQEARSRKGPPRVILSNFCGGPDHLAIELRING